MTLAADLAVFAAAPLRGADTAREVMRLSLLDWAAVGIAGRDEPVARILRDRALRDGGRAVASLIGASERVPPAAAALANGTISHALDYDDTHFAHIGHPSVAVIPAVLALAEQEGAGMAELVEAALVGVEASVRFGVWLGRGHYQTGFHQTATAGAIGATVGAARILGLDPAVTQQALGLVATRASGLKSQFGTMGKPFNAGIAAANGVEAADLAAAGFVSNPAALDGPQGFGPTHHGAADPAAWDGLGQNWLFEGVSHKFHACCHGLHAMLEALRDQTATGVEAVEILTHPRWLTVCNQPEPATGLEAKFSYRLTAAMALAGRDTGALSSFTAEATRDPALVALRDRVRVTADPDLTEMQARVRLTRGGTTQELFHDLDAAQPLAARAAKIGAKAAALLGAEWAEATWAAIVSDDLAWFTAALRGD